MAGQQLAFIDTNVFVRWLTRDEPAQAKRAAELLQRVETGEISAVTSEAVIVELVYALSSKRTYNRTRDEIRARLHDLLTLKGLRLSRKLVYGRALDLYVANPSIDFVDCLNVAHMEHASIREIYTFDKDYARLKGIDAMTSRAP